MFPLAKAKCLLKFMGKELIVHKIEILRKAGVEDIVVVASPTNVSELKELLGDSVEFAVQNKPLGMADAIMSGAHLVQGEEVLIINAEDILEPAGLKTMMEGPGDSRLIGYQVDAYFPGGYFKLDGDRIVGMIEKPGEGNEPSDLVSIGVYLHRKFDDLIQYIEKAASSKDDVYEVAMDMMMKAGYDFRVARYSGPWIPLKYPWHIFEIRDYFYSKIAEARVDPSANIHETAIIDGKVVIEPDVRIFEHAVVRGPCYLGKGCIIGNNSLVWGGTHLGEGSVVGYSTELKNTHTGDNVWFHQNYVGDSIIMDDCSFGAKTTTANYRFDEKNIRIRIDRSMVDTGQNKFGVIMGPGTKTGITVGIMPGVRIGAGCFIGPHVLVKNDMEPGKAVFAKQELITMDSWIKLNTDRKCLKEKIGKKE